MADDHSDDTPPAGIATTPIRPNGGARHDDASDGPDITTEEYQRHLVGKIGGLEREVGRLARASVESGNQSVAALRASRAAQSAAEAVGRTVETLATDIKGAFEGFARAHAAQAAAMAPLLSERTEWGGAKAVGRRVFAVLGVIGGIIAGALTAYAHLKGH